MDEQLVDCPVCGQRKERHPVDTHICADCVHVENNRLTYYRQHQGDWVAKAKDAGIDLWLQQPEETQWEYTVWVKYRDSYPGKKPTYSGVAREMGTTYNVVSKIAQRWSFQMRMQAWMANVDSITMLQRRQEILDMNKQHVDMAKTINQKLSVAIDLIEPHMLKPGEIVNLGKMAAEMERKAHIDTLAQEEIRASLLVDTENPNLKKSVTKQDDLSEVVAILAKAGVLGNITQIGVRQVETKTTEIIGLGAGMERSDENEINEQEDYYEG